MLPRERVLKTLQHQEPEPGPWGEPGVDYKVYEALLGRPTLLHAKFRETQALWEGRRDEVVADYKRDTIELHDALGMDIITVDLVPPAGYQPKPMKQIDERTYEDEAGNLHRISATTHDLMPFRTRTDSYTAPTREGLQEQIDKIDAEGVPPLDESELELVRYVVKEKKATHWINVFGGDITFPGFGPTDQEFYTNLALHPELHGKLTELAAKRVIASLPHYAETGVDSVMGCCDYGSSTALLASPEVLAQHMAPWFEKIVQAAHSLGLRYMKHSCGGNWEALPHFIEAGYDAYEGIQASAGMDIKLLKQFCADKLTLWGGVTNENLILGTPDQVRADGLYALRWGAPGGGFIYGASHSLAVGTTLENLLAMKEIRDKYGAYPIHIPEGLGEKPGLEAPTTIPQRFRDMLEAPPGLVAYGNR